MTRSNLNDWITIYFNSLFDCHQWVSLWVFIFSIQLNTKTKTWPPWSLLVRKCVCKLKEKLHLLWRTRGLHLATAWKDWLLCLEFNYYENNGLGPCVSLVQSLLPKRHSHIPRENKHEWYKNTQRRWLWVVCPRKTNTAWPVGNMADNNTR